MFGITLVLEYAHYYGVWIEVICFGFVVRVSFFDFFVVISNGRKRMQIWSSFGLYLGGVNLRGNLWDTFDFNFYRGLSSL